MEAAETHQDKRNRMRKEPSQAVEQAPLILWIHPTPDDMEALKTLLFRHGGAVRLPPELLAPLKKANVEAHETETKRRLEVLRSIFAAANEGFIVLDLLGNGEDRAWQVSFVSDACGKLLSIHLEDLHGRSLEEIVEILLPGASAAEREEVAASFRAGNAKFEIPAPERGRASHRWLEVRATKIQSPSDGKRYLLLVLFDITERRLKDETIRLQQDEVMRAGKLASLGEMAAGIAHELNTPLNAIQGYVDIVKMMSVDGVPPPEVTREALENIEKTVRKIAEIIVGLKSVAKMDQVKTPKLQNLKDLIDQVLKVCDFHLKNKGTKVEVDFSALQDLVIECYPTQIAQVFINLVNNAVDAVKNLETKWIKIDAKDLGDEVQVRVTDSGDGIPEKLAAQIMTPFFTTKKEGTGLGLSLSTSIVKAHGGTLDVDQSVPNTCFRVRLPKKMPKETRERL